MTEATRDFRVFPKQWGAEFIRAGDVRFQIWAPGLEQLFLRLNGDDAPMGRDADGWFELMASGVEAGAMYQFILPDGRQVPDPASRAQRGDVHGPSLVVDPTAYRWRNSGWRGRPWNEAVVYELHVGTFTAEGTFAAAAKRLSHLADLGITAVEIMPVAQFQGQRGWGYDGVLPYAPHNSYGSPDDLKSLVDDAHGLGLMVMLDVVYNHFGPDGNYLPAYAPSFFDESRHTPWGAAIDYGQPAVRRFFIENACYWLEEFGFDGLRLDAIDHIRDRTDPELLVELARRVREEFADRHVHLVTEDNRNVTYLHERQDGATSLYTAEWNDDFHNAAHVLLTGEHEGYYEDFAQEPKAQLERCLSEGFAYQGEPSRHDDGKPRGSPSRHLPTTAFVNFLQNHDQVGNRAMGERLSAITARDRLEALTAILLMSPHVPMLFMGEEWGETRPFLFFTDFHGELADAVREGRRKEFAKFSAFDTARERAAIPDPNAVSTFEMSKLDWDLAQSEDGRSHMQMIRTLLSLRKEHVMPCLDDARASPGRRVASGEGILAIDWQLPSAKLQLRANLGSARDSYPAVSGDIIYQTKADQASTSDELDPWHVVFALER